MNSIIRLVHRQEPVLAPLQNKAGQTASRKCPRIDVNPIWEDFWLLDRRVAVDNPFSEIKFAIQKFVSDPQQILGALAIKGNARPYAGMTKKEGVGTRRQFH